jgi:hypothetical protein
MHSDRSPSLEKPPQLVDNHLTESRTQEKMEFEISLDDLANDDSAIVGGGSVSANQNLEVSLEDITGGNNTAATAEDENKEPEVGIDIDALSELGEMFLTDGKKYI